MDMKNSPKKPRLETLQIAALRKSSKVELLEIIRAALDCPSHIDKPTIINNDKYFTFGDHPMVLCSQCVDRMRSALTLEPGETGPCYFHFENLEVSKWRKMNKSIQKAKKRNGRKS